MKFPRRLRHNDRGKVLAIIYKRRDCYRVCWRSTVDGRRVGRSKEFRTFTKAVRFGRQRVKDLAKGRTVLTPEQTKGAAAAFELLQGFYAETGKRVPLLECVADYCGALKKLGERPLGEAVDGYLSTVATVKRKDVDEAVEEWIAGRQSKTVAAKPGKRPQLSPGYFYNCNLCVREFAKTFPGHAVCDLSKEHLDLYMAQHAGLAPKSRNERRMTLRMFLKWAAAKDYLPATHRLLEAPGMGRELAEAAEIAPYTAEELQAMLDRASKAPAPVKEGEKPEADYRHLLPIIALVALGGIRLQEATRLTWENVWRVAGHIEVSVAKSKTRSRRLSTMCASLAQWLEPYRSRSRATVESVPRPLPPRLREDAGRVENPRPAQRAPARVRLRALRAPCGRGADGQGSR